MAMEELSIEQLQTLINQKKQKKRKMKTAKKALASGLSICVILLIFVMTMIYIGRDTQALNILAGAAVGIIPILIGIYQGFETRVDLKHMEKNYIENYDEINNIY